METQPSVTSVTPSTSYKSPGSEQEASRPKDSLHPQTPCDPQPHSFLLETPGSQEYATPLRAFSSQSIGWVDMEGWYDIILESEFVALSSFFFACFAGGLIQSHWSVPRSDLLASAGGCILECERISFLELHAKG